MHRIIRRASRMLLAVATVAALTACSSSRNAAKPSAAGTKASTAEAYAKRVAANFQTSAAITAKTAIDLNNGGKTFSLGGTLRMKRDDVIQISMTFLGMEVARLEFTPDYVLIVDRFNKQYVKATYADASFLKSANLDFYVLQSMFWNELFVPGERNVKSALGKFTMASSGDHTLLSLTSSPKLDYEFLTQTATALLDRVTVNPKNVSAKESLVCKYSGFGDFGGHKFPSTIALEMRGTSRELGLTLGLSRLSSDSKWQTRTEVPGSYKQRSVDEILKKLSSIQQ